MARPDKEASVREIADRFRDTDAALLTEYRGLRVSEIAEVRSALREADADYKVLKNTLARLAVREVGLEELVDMLTGPTAIAFIRGDAAAAAKALDDAAKKFPVLAIKGGVLSGTVIDAERAKQLASLEPRDVLLAKIAMMMNQPAQQAVNVLAALLRDLGSMLAQVQAKKESGELPGGEAPVGEAAAETTPAAPPGDETLTQPEVDDAEKAEEAAAADEGAEEAAKESEPPAETAEALDQAPAAPESGAAEEQDTPGDETGDETAKEEE